MEGQRDRQNKRSGGERELVPAMMPVDVLGELSVLSEGAGELRVAAKGAVISVDLPSVGAGRILARQVAARMKRHEAIERLHAGLRLADLTLEVSVAGTPVAHLAPASEATLLSRLLGVSPMQLKPMGLVRALFHRRPD